jgi:hypothetical protein
MAGWGGGNFTWADALGVREAQERVKIAMVKNEQ